MKLVIDRKKWGTGAKGGFLINGKTGLMCCLGFAGIACGLSKQDLIGYSMPWWVGGGEAKKNVALWETLAKGCRLGGISDKLATANDEYGVRRSVREKRITRLFKTIGVTVEFKN